MRQCTSARCPECDEKQEILRSSESCTRRARDCGSYECQKERAVITRN